MTNSVIMPALYHATPYWNFDPILRRGVDPKFSRGELPVSWWCSVERVEWAIQHCAARYSIGVREVVVFEVEEKPKAYFFIAPQTGVFRSGLVIRPTAIYPAYNWFPTEV